MDLLYHRTKESVFNKSYNKRVKGEPSEITAGPNVTND
jgi:hypothetical protein